MNWTIITDLGDSAVMVPMALIIAAWLLASNSRRDAAVWLVLFGTGIVLVISTKIAFLGWGVGIKSLDFTGISGHSMTAASTLTVAGYFAGERYSKTAATIGACLGCLLASAIAFSRVMLGVHSTSEVVIGSALGCSIALASIATIRAHPRSPVAPIVFLFALLAFVVTVHGKKAPSEHLIVKIALYLSSRSAPFNRFDAWRN